MPDDHVLTPDLHETIIIFPGGGIHAQGPLMKGPEPPKALLDRVCGPPRPATSLQGQPIRLSIGYPDGHVEHHQIAVDGTIHPSHDPSAAQTTPDPIWNRSFPQESRLLDTVRAAQRAGQWRTAQQSAQHATQHVIAQHGRDHPYAAMGVELQAHFALMAQDCVAGAALYTEAALAMHRLGGPPAQIHRALANAAAAWIQSDRDARPVGLGFTIAHALIRITPPDPAPLAALLRRLTKERA